MKSFTFPLEAHKHISGNGTCSSDAVDLKCTLISRMSFCCICVTFALVSSSHYLVINFRYSVIVHWVALLHCFAFKLWWKLKSKDCRCQHGHSPYPQRWAWPLKKKVYKELNGNRTLKIWNMQFVVLPRLMCCIKAKNKCQQSTDMQCWNCVIVKH